MIRRICKSVALIALICGVAGHASGEITPTFDDDVQAILADNKIASVSFASIKHGRLDKVAAYGWQSDGVPATTRTLYNIASLTKPLTAEIILRLASRGKMALDEPMTAVWADPDIVSDERRKLLTLRFVLSHRSGFPNWRNKKTGLAFERTPGEKWGYSGEGYQYAARFAELKMGKPFQTVAGQLLFGPSHMTTTSYARQLWFDGHIAVPTDSAGKPLPPAFAAPFNAADLVYSTPRDYAAFMIDVLNDRRLSPAIARERNSSQTDMMEVTCTGAKAASCPPHVGFGLGWQILAFKDETLMMHTGKDEGVFTFAYLNRTSQDGVVIFTNSDNGYKVILPLLNRLNTSPAFLLFLHGQID